MANEGFNRKLAAILSADVKGYSRLMEEARFQTDEAMKMNPKFSLIIFEKRLPYTNLEVQNRFIDALRKVGLLN